MSKLSTRIINVGICGLGTVGGGTLALLKENNAEISRRVGASIQVSYVASRSLNPEQVKNIPGSGTDPLAVADDPSIDIVVETMGGYDPAFGVVKKALLNGKHVFFNETNVVPTTLVVVGPLNLQP